MKLTNAERQKRYRERALRDPDGHLLTRLQCYLKPSAAANLERIVRATGKSKQDIVNDAIIQLAEYLGCDTEQLYCNNSNYVIFLQRQSNYFKFFTQIGHNLFFRFIVNQVIIHLAEQLGCDTE